MVIEEPQAASQAVSQAASTAAAGGSVEVIPEEATQVAILPDTQPMNGGVGIVLEATQPAGEVQAGPQAMDTQA